MFRARPIETVIAAPDTEPHLAARLRTALNIRDFASRVLGLPANASYRRYVDLDRRHVVWSVVAAPELSLEPRHWCFPVAGCLSYRGYFSESAAEEYAESLKSEGWDVTVAGVRAYSTLGWFDDPLLSSMVDLPEYFLAGIVFHELAHQRRYVPGDTGFNESLAVVIERAGVDRWIEAAGRAELSERYRIAAERRAAFLALVRDLRVDLEALYASSRSDAEKRAAKAERIDRLRARYAELREEWTSGPTYGRLVRARCEQCCDRARVHLRSVGPRTRCVARSVRRRPRSVLPRERCACGAASGRAPVNVGGVGVSRSAVLANHVASLAERRSVPYVWSLVQLRRLPLPIERTPGSLDRTYLEWPLSLTVRCCEGIRATSDRRRCSTIRRRLYSRVLCPYRSFSRRVSPWKKLTQSMPASRTCEGVSMP